MIKKLTASYDNSVDVLYLSLAHHAPDRYEEDAEGLVWRYDEDGVPYGVTILDFHECWGRRRRMLINRIAAILNIPKEDVKKVLH